MARDLQQLKDGLASFLLDPGSFPASAIEAAQKWSDAYTANVEHSESCSNGVPGTGNVISASAGNAALSSALASAFVSGNPSSAASGFQAGLDAFWPLTSFQGIASLGVAAPSTLGPAFNAALASVFAANLEASPQEAVDNLAATLEQYTSGVLVTHPTPDTCVLTIV